ncbi:MAG: electron transfer flavoprotein subunit beta/FixA family protein [Alicyclobacillus mali]|uniref:electron transfer flavoprotein subunit beta/FixA family protein n=1 Tax=Alicyclobacillus mali (ex Roth et al. 2021) TaxID=1123961 RepID=UPI000835328B|nr:electron transfer flavoprotein subunit beta/FixA family protein [Alicyclobacillus mali (ex Roth et al. 2021)]MCL6487646.1 electron transfer flavoprotein subunit beta/FixA family protein [Alicyclobacillus mali (ex Roth et al. 2021)]
MHVVVLMKQTFDTEERIRLADGKIAEDGVKWIINPYDEYAVEEAIQLKENQGATVTVVSVGNDNTTQALRTALAMGADEAVLIEAPELTDERAIAKAIVAYLKDKSFDVLLAGNFSVDNGAGQVAIRVAHELGLPHIAAVTQLTIEGNQATGVREVDGDVQTVTAVLPALFTAQQGLNEPRYPSLPNIMKAKKKPLTTLTLSDLGLSSDDAGAKVERVEVTLPPKRQAGQKITGTPDEQAEQLAEILAKALR